MVLKQQKNIPSRSDLMTLLTEACELEHGLACSYLYAAFSLKQDLTEGGLTWRQLHAVKKWAAQIYLVAAQEMFHLSQAWNILSALGGTPYYMRPNFPQSTNYYPLGLPLLLEPFGSDSLTRFIQYELPQQQDQKEYLKNEGGFRGEESFLYRTVGELYHLIAQGISAERPRAANLFVGNPKLQVGSDLIDFPEIVKVTDKETALEAIRRITEQGEGTAVNHEDCHYGTFKQILRELDDEKSSAGPSFMPVREVISNPVVHIKGDYRVERGNQITHPRAHEVADIFDDLYNLMLRILQFVFSVPNQTQEHRKKLAEFSIALMPMVIKPLGDAIMVLPAGDIFPGKSAGPAFSMSRHVSLPGDERVAHLVIGERYAELIARTAKVRDQSGSPYALVAAHRNMITLRGYLP